MLNRARPYLEDMGKVAFLLDPKNWANLNPVSEFEAAFAEKLGVPRAIATDQGRTALLLGLKALNIKRGDEVVVQSLICNVVIDAILKVGAIPVLVDSSLDDFQVIPDEIRAKITIKTKAIIVAHLYGIPCQIAEIRNIAKQNGCYLIEDCAHSLGAQYAGQATGTYGDIAYFSFNFDKPLSTGQGGMLVINNQRLAPYIEKTLKQYKRVPLSIEQGLIYGFILQYLLTQKDSYHQFLPTTFGESLIRDNPGVSSILAGLLNEGVREEEVRRSIIVYLNEHDLLPQRQTKIRRALSRIRSLIGRFYRFRPTSVNNVAERDLLMNSLRAQLGLDQLHGLDLANKLRNEAAQYLSEQLDRDLFKLPNIKAEAAPTFLRYPLLNHTRVPSSGISQAAIDEGFEIGNYNWPVPIHLMAKYWHLIPH